MAAVAQLATAGGGRMPLGHLGDHMFLALTNELQSRGLTKKVIADMLGMSLRTYHRRVHEVRQRQHAVARTVWEAVLELIGAAQPISGRAIQVQLFNYDGELISGALNDLTKSGLVQRTGWGDAAVYRLEREASGRSEPVGDVRVAG